ncbi:MAG: MBL fold metallo-hydrolase [Candidatus Thermoplasmatota archaeon]|nr:MBL fold metallo-hydrolase [Candidatus Thermoplasmatota archaeon]
MLFERIKSEGLAHYSYIIGDQNDAVVIDPRRDIQKYIDLASQHGMNIKKVLETHRNEDYVIGSYEIKKRTGAEIYHADGDLDYTYGKPVEENDSWDVGRLKLEAIHTPGHTLGSMSYILYDPDGEPWMVFIGDALFAGDVGRIDFYGEENLEKMAYKLYDSIFKKILPLGDGVMICPAHGSGSVCGTEIAERELTTVGIEKERNPKLQIENKEEFAEKVSEMLEYPPYFEKMEEMNLDLPEHQLSKKTMEFLSPEEFKKRAEDAVILDTRKELAFGASHIPDTLSIWEDGIPNFAGWFLPYDKPILLVDEAGNPARAHTYLKRIGYDNVEGCLAGGMLSWNMQGEESESIDTVNVHEVCNILDEDESTFLLDVRPQEEIEKKGEIEGAYELHLTQLPDNLEEIPEDRPIYIFCGSGLRSMTAASILKKNGWDDLHVVLGGLSGWSSTTCPVK